MGRRLASKLGLGVAAAPDPSAVADLGLELEQLGYDSAWSNDTPMGEGLALLAEWAQRSHTIALGVGVLALDRHSPASIADRVNESQLPRARLLLGLGAGFAQRPVTDVRRGVAAVRGLLPDVRVLVAAMGPQMCRTAGEIADGVLLNWMTPERAAWARDLIYEEAQRAGRDPGAVTVFGYVRVALGADAQQRLEREVYPYTQMPHYARHFTAMAADPAAVGIALENPADLPARLAEYEALDVLVIRALADRRTAAVMELAHAAIA